MGLPVLVSEGLDHQPVTVLGQRVTDVRRGA
jgi:hypothetical protein